MKRFFYVVLPLAVMFSSGVNAISIYEGTVTSLLAGPNYGSYVYIAVDRVSGTISNELPNCDNPNHDYLLNVDTDEGRMYFSLLLSAFMAGKTVNLQGYDECAGNVEKLRHVWVK